MLGSYFHHAVHLKLASLTESARHVNRSPSTLAEALQRYRRIEPILFVEFFDDQ